MMGLLTDLFYDNYITCFGLANIDNLRTCEKFEGEMGRGGDGEIQKFIFNFGFMKAVTIKTLRDDLTNCTPKELRDLTLRLARFKKENKELLTYLLYEASDEESFIAGVKKEVDLQFDEINKKSYYLIKKSARKILAYTRKNIRYSLKKETEVELLLYFCLKLKKLTPSIHKNTGLQNLYIRLINVIRKKLTSLHEDLQYDYGLEIRELTE